MSLRNSRRCRPGRRMSSRYALLPLVELAEQTVEEDLGEADGPPLSGVRSSWDMLARNSDL